MNKTTIVNWLILLTLSFIWGSSFILMKKSLIDFNYLEVAFFRLIIAFLVLSPFCINSLKNMEFSKFELKGGSVYEELQKLCTANVKNEIGRCTYTQMLNSDGGIETDLTVVCISENHFRIIGAAATRERDKFHIKKHIGQNIKLTDVANCSGIIIPGGFGNRGVNGMLLVAQFCREKNIPILRQAQLLMSSEFECFLV